MRKEEYAMKKAEFSNNKRNKTLYGEFVCSSFSWLPINKQKEKASRLEKMTCDDEKITENES